MADTTQTAGIQLSQLHDRMRNLTATNRQQAEVLRQMHTLITAEEVHHAWPADGALPGRLERLLAYYREKISTLEERGH